MKKVLKEYLSFNKSERRGLFVLLFLLVLLILTNLLLPHFFSTREYDFSAFKEEILAFEKTRKEIKKKSYAQRYYPRGYERSGAQSRGEESHLAPFSFDPNTMTAADWQRLGLTTRQIRMLTNFRNKGGTFRSKADFKKMYCISATEYEVLAPFITLPETSAKAHSQQPWTEQKKTDIIERVELNTAQADDLTKLKGIGDYFAGKIIAYRSALGGFLRIEQLLEIPKFDSVLYQRIAPQLTVNPRAIRRKNVNSASFDELKSHPYIGYNIALSLTNYRKEHGPFDQLEDIKKSALITEKVYKRIAPYLKVD